MKLERFLELNVVYLAAYETGGFLFTFLFLYRCLFVVCVTI